MNVLAIAAQKGGVGKTTTAVYTANYIAHSMCATAERPLVGLIDREETRNLTTLARLGEARLAPGVVLLPGYDVPRDHPTLRLVVVDTPPGYMAIKSLEEANLVAIPAIPESNGIVNLIDYLKLLDDAKVSVNPRLRLVAVLPTMVMNNELHRQRLTEIKAIAGRRHPPLVVLDPIPRRIDIARYKPSPAYAAATAEIMRYAAIE